MVSYCKIISIFMLSAASLVSAAYSALSNCFTVQAFCRNGTSLGFFNVADQELGIYTALASDSSLATKFGVDASTGHLLDYDESPYTGLIAAGDYDAWYFTYLYFDTTQDLQDTETAERVPLDCVLGFNGILTCTHPTNPAYSVIQYCTRYGGELAIWHDIKSDWDCEAITLSVTVAEGCTIPPPPPMTTPAVTTTITTLPTGSSTPSQQRLCTSESHDLCADGFLVKCDKLPSNVAPFWFLVPGINTEIGCHQACVSDETCGGWKYYEEEIDLLYCQHTHDMFSSNVEFRFEYYFYSSGIRGICQ